MFKMEMPCIRASCSCVCFVLVNLLAAHSVVSFVVAIPVSQCSAPPKKGKRLHLGCGLLEAIDLSITGSFVSSCIAVSMMGSYDWEMFQYWRILLGGH